ncbi:unnamed protein product [Clonostachys rosea f. rosea IK726]|uniref:Uncharacterized protein n=1 Tax=Clonostachys rosea f. rosea IK726 TaxID=1349383 RepID=A0ACA9UUJ1_BIOOC|nr:unnamed protein product [Clonostachys rosea f. rosea IK726]
MQLCVDVDPKFWIYVNITSEGCKGESTPGSLGEGESWVCPSIQEPPPIKSTAGSLGEGQNWFIIFEPPPSRVREASRCKDKSVFEAVLAVRICTCFEKKLKQRFISKSCCREERRFEMTDVVGICP